MKSMSLNRGFTLIELLVVIAIIALLSSVVFASMKTARDKARVANTIQSIEQMELAFNMIYQDKGCWPLEATTSNACVSTTIVNPYIYSELIASDVYGIKAYMTGKPNFAFDPSKEWTYSNNNKDEVDCTADNDGIEIYIPNTSSKYYELLEMAIDKTAQSDLYIASSTYCGKIQYEPTGGGRGDIDYIISKTVK